MTFNKQSKGSSLSAHILKTVHTASYILLNFIDESLVILFYESIILSPASMYSESDVSMPSFPDVHMYDSSDTCLSRGGGGVYQIIEVDDGLYQFLSSQGQFWF